MCLLKIIQKQKQVNLSQVNTSASLVSTTTSSLLYAKKNGWLTLTQMCSITCLIIFLCKPRRLLWMQQKIWEEDWIYGVWVLMVTIFWLCVVWSVCWEFVLSKLFKMEDCFILNWFRGPFINALTLSILYAKSSDWW